MTDDDQFLTKEKMDRRKQRQGEREKDRFMRSKIQKILKNPEKFISKITSYTKDGTSAQSSNEQMFMSQFQRLNQKFNNDILEKSSNWGEKDIWDAPSDDQDRNLYKLPRPKSYLINKKSKDTRDRSRRVISGVNSSKGLLRVSSSSGFKSMSRRPIQGKIGFPKRDQGVSSSTGNLFKVRKNLKSTSQLKKAPVNGKE